jgi:hypothetical protein
MSRQEAGLRDDLRLDVEIQVRERRPAVLAAKISELRVNELLQGRGRM